MLKFHKKNFGHNTPIKAFDDLPHGIINPSLSKTKLGNTRHTLRAKGKILIANKQYQFEWANRIILST